MDTLADRIEKFIAWSTEGNGIEEGLELTELQTSITDWLIIYHIFNFFDTCSVAMIGIFKMLAASALKN